MGIFLDMTLNTTTLDITPETLKLIAEIDEFKGAWPYTLPVIGGLFTALGAFDYNQHSAMHGPF